MSASTLSLIGMPGAGKSTVGVALAKSAQLGFIDSDLEIQLREGASLQDIVEHKGYLVLRTIEEEVLLTMPLSHSVVATGGSAIYSGKAMQRLSTAGPLVYLRAELATLQARVAKHPLRGIASDPAESFAAIFTERTPFYARYADITIDVASCSVERLVEQILDAV
jgi:shikimate kinase